MTKTTKAQIEALKTILAAGGLWEERLHMGRKHPGMANKALVRRLVEMGLVEAVREENPARQKYRECGGVTTSTRFYVTAAGALAVNAADKVAQS